MYRVLICKIYVKGNLVENEIWWKMKFGEYFGVRWRLMHQKGEGNASKRETIILIVFSRCQIIKATSGYYNSSDKYLNVQLHF